MRTTYSRIKTLISHILYGGGGLALGIALLLFARTSFADEIELGKWIYLPTDGEAKGVISNATGISTDWVLNVYESNTAAHQLTLGTNITEGVAGSAYVYNEEGKIRGSEILDLRESITTLDGIKWTITSLGAKNPSCLNNKYTPLRTFYAPRELTTFGGSQLFNFTPKNEDGKDASFDFANSPWFVRGGHWYGGSVSGIFTFAAWTGASFNESTFRIVLTPI